ncbi:MAG: 16S rRNA (guanine(966)-N(2))-methyltransferase RsmD [Pseudomonadota bacterium]
MRIVGGRLSGRRLVAPDGEATRPTTDRVRESLFNILAHRVDVELEGARVLDLFAGTGALGLEAISRGASAGTFVETAAAARGALRTNIHALGVQGVARILRRDAVALGGIGTMMPFSLVFLDPPYGKRLAERALVSAAEGGWLVDGAIAVVEEAQDAAFELPEQFMSLDERRVGVARLRLLQFQGS